MNNNTINTINWELRKDALIGMAATGYRMTMIESEKGILHDDSYPPDDVIRNKFYVRYTPVMEIFDGDKLLGMPSDLIDELEKHPCMQKTEADVLYNLSEKVKKMRELKNKRNKTNARLHN